MCKSKIEVSVVLATYNGEKYIQKQLESLMNQSHKADEVVIVDDKSTDATYKIVVDFIKKNSLENWKAYLNKENLGYKKNFYKGIEFAKGDYLFLCDQDDEWQLDKIELMLGVMKDNPKLQALNCAVKIIDGESKEIPYKTEKNMYNCGFLYSEKPIGDITYFSFPYLLKHNISPGCTMVITKQLKKVFIETYDFALPHDWHLNLLAGVDYACAFFNKPLVRYRRHSNNVIGANTGFIEGILSRTREFRVNSCEDKEFAVNSILSYYREISGGEYEQLDVAHRNDELNRVLRWNTAYKKFFELPNLTKLLELYRHSEYRETTRAHIRIWNIVVALNLDNYLIKLVKKTKKERNK